MKRSRIVAISAALAMGLATTCWAAEGTGTGTGAGAPATGMDSGKRMNNTGMSPNGSGMKSTGENKGLPGGHSGDDMNKPANGDHGNNGANGG